MLVRAINNLRIEARPLFRRLIVLRRYAREVRGVQIGECLLRFAYLR